MAIAMKLSEAISKRIHMLCQERGISTEQLVAKVNADRYEVVAVIKGHGPAPLNIMGGICLVLGVTTSEFFHHSLFESF